MASKLTPISQVDDNWSIGARSGSAESAYPSKNLPSSVDREDAVNKHTKKKHKKNQNWQKQGQPPDLKGVGTQFSPSQ